MVVNAWRAKINQNLKVSCPFGEEEMKKIQTSLFLKMSPSAKNLAFNIINRLQSRPSRNGPWKNLAID
jgi:hypothetical protein